MTSAQPRFRLHTKRKPELLFAVMRMLAHEDHDAPGPDAQALIRKKKSRTKL
jgi:hypothetical protein